MSIAALYDIHGNLPALEAVLAEVDGEGIDEILVGGDVLPGPMSRDCLELLNAAGRPVRFIHGNGETAALAVSRGEEPSAVPEHARGAVRWAAATFGPAEVAAMSTWPLTARADVEGLGGVLFCHATPRNENEIFTRLTPEERLAPVFAGCGAAVVVCGHTHMQFDRRVGEIRVVNAGSVGMPFGDPGAHWAVLSGDGVEHRRTMYDLEAAAERIRAVGYPLDLDPRHPPAEEDVLEAFETASLR